MKWKPIKSVDWLVIHCAATQVHQDIGVEAIRDWHLKRGWLDVGYHYVIRRNGVIEKGRPENRPGAHARGINHASLGICMVGGADAKGNEENNFTSAQWRSLRDLVEELELRYPDAPVIGHRDLPSVNKACPSFEVLQWYENTFGRDQRNKQPGA